MLNVIEIVLPVFLVVGLGYTIRRIGLVDGHFFSQVNQLVYYVCLPLLLIYKIAGADFSTSFNFKLVLATSAALATTIKLILLPLITALFMLVLNISGLDFAIGLLMAGAPTAVATYIMACQMGADGELAGTIVMMATALSAVSYTILLLCLNRYGM